MTAMPAVFADQVVGESGGVVVDALQGGVGEVTAVEWHSSWEYNKQVTDGSSQTSDPRTVDVGTSQTVGVFINPLIFAADVLSASSTCTNNKRTCTRTQTSPSITRYSCSPCQPKLLKVILQEHESVGVQTDPVVTNSGVWQHDELPPGCAEAVKAVADVMIAALDANIVSHAFDGYDVQWESVRNETLNPVSAIPSVYRHNLSQSYCLVAVVVGAGITTSVMRAYTASRSFSRVGLAVRCGGLECYGCRCCCRLWAVCLALGALSATTWLTIVT